MIKLGIYISKIYYNTTYVFINTNSIPSWNIGPSWSNNPNNASAKNVTFTYKLTASQNTGTKTATSNGAIGLWNNGVEIYNANDVRSNKSF